MKSIVINKSKTGGSGAGATTLNDGLTYGNYPFGTRVQDETISLNAPDVISIHGVFESADTSDQSCPKATLTSIVTQSTTTNELIIGEQLVGQDSEAVAIVAEKITGEQIGILYKNEILFKEGETIIFQESGAQAIISTLDSPSFAIGANYTFANGGESTFYDYGILKKKAKADVPSRKMKVYYQSGSYDSGDTGDITTINSYEQFKYGWDRFLFLSSKS